MIDTLKYLKKHGQRLDLDLARDRGIRIDLARQHLTELAERGEIVMCKVTRFEGDTRIDGWLCRISGYSPPPAPGRKAKGAGAPPA
jgi:hypothetical protein